MMKGITPIIATIVLLFITMALLALAYPMLTGFIQEKNLVFTTDPLSCNDVGGLLTISIYARNTGSKAIAIPNEIDILEIDGTDISGTATFPKASLDVGKASKIATYDCGGGTGCTSGKTYSVKIGVGGASQTATVLC